MKQVNSDVLRKDYGRFSDSTDSTDNNHNLKIMKEFNFFLQDFPRYLFILAFHTKCDDIDFTAIFINLKKKLLWQIFGDIKISEFHYSLNSQTAPLFWHFN